MLVLPVSANDIVGLNRVKKPRGSALKRVLVCDGAAYIHVQLHEWWSVWGLCFLSVKKYLQNECLATAEFDHLKETGVSQLILSMFSFWPNMMNLQ